MKAIHAQNCAQEKCSYATKKVWFEVCDLQQRLYYLRTCIQAKTRTENPFKFIFDANKVVDVYCTTTKYIYFK